MELDLPFVRAQFPAFEAPELAGQAFFENAGGSYPSRFVTDRLERYYRSRKVQPYAPYAAAMAAGDEMDEARTRLSAMLNVAPDELSFGPSTSANTYTLAQAFRQMLPEGAAIIVTNQDHEANTGAWRRLADAGIEVREWCVDPVTGHLALSALDALLDDKVALLAMPHCSNIVGEINPVAEIAEKLHAVGGVVCVDGVSYAPHGLPDVDALGADIYLFSAYKTYGPHQGLMVIRSALAARLPNQGHYFNAGSPTSRFTPAGPDHAQIAASAGMADYIDALYNHHFNSPAPPAQRAAKVHDLMRAAEISTLQPLLDYLAKADGVRLIGPRDAALKAPTVAIDLGRAAEPVAASLAKHGIMAGGGDFYAVRLLEALGIDPDTGVLRLSFVHYTSTDEVAALITALEKTL